MSNQNNFECSCCHRTLPLDELGAVVQEDKYCVKCVNEIRSAFSYHIKGEEISKEKHDRIIKRGYYIEEELDKDRDK